MFGEKKKDHSNLLWNVDLQMRIENVTFVLANKESVTQLCRNLRSIGMLLFLWFHFSEIGFYLGLIEDGDWMQPDLHRNNFHHRAN